MSPKLKKYSVIIICTVLLFTMCFNIFASPGYDRGSAYSNNIPDSGYIEVQSVDYTGYAVNRFILGGYSRDGMYSMDGINVSLPQTDGIYTSIDYTFTHSLGGIQLSMPIAFFRVSDGEIIPNSFANVTFNKDVYMFVEFDVLEPDGSIGSIVQEQYISANSPIKWVNNIPSGVNTVLNYNCKITFSTMPMSGVVLTYVDSYTNSYSNTLNVLVGNNNYNSGYDQGFLDGKQVGREEGYDIGYDDGLEADTFGGFGDFIVTVLGGFLSAPLIGGITFGGILIAFVGFALCIWLLKLLAGG